MPLEKNKVDIGRWTSPLKLFEYMAAAKPIICSDIPVLREVMQNNVDGLLCPPDNIQAWEQALRSLMQDKEFAKKLGRQAQEIFLENYTWDARAKNILKALTNETEKNT